MSHELSRRSVLKWSIAAAAGGSLTSLTPGKARAIDFDKPVPAAAGVTATLDRTQVIVRYNDMPLTTYRAYPSLKYPYFYPINGPATWSSLVTESDAQYHHHRGVWLGLQQGKFGDFWGPTSLDLGHIKSVELALAEVTPTSAVITNRCEWVLKDQPSPFLDDRKITIGVLNDKVWVIDVEIKLTAQTDVEIGRAKHSFFAMRAASDISPYYGSGVLMNSEGGVDAGGRLKVLEVAKVGNTVGAELDLETYEKPAKWCGYHGKRKGSPDVVEGIAIMDHPDNPFSKQPWFTRAYGHLSAPGLHFTDEPWRVGKGQSVVLKYRVANHAGTPQEAGLDRVYKQWIG